MKKLQITKTYTLFFLVSKTQLMDQKDQGCSKVQVLNGLDCKREFITTDIDALIWVFIPFLAIVIWVVLAKARPSITKPNRKNLVAGIVVAIIILSVYYYVRCVIFPPS